MSLSRWLPLVFVAACSGRACDSSSDGAAPAASASPSRQPDPALPGLGAGDPVLMKRLRAALAARGPDYRPRTHHLLADGSPKFINRLILETSPYLLQHAHNPVNWYPWGSEAFERARREGKPVLLSVGYSTCHWCHVMERESFEDEEIARTLNEHFVAIKVDREQRPDVDAIYMQAVQMLTGRGGWPMTVLLTPEKQPFFGGTYFPARDGDRGSGKGFLTILREMKREYGERPGDVVARAKKLSQRIAQTAAPRALGNVPGPELVDRAARSFAQTYDPVWGGFGRAPKFPRPVTLELLLRYHRRTGDPQAKQMVLHTLEKMAAGGVYDQVGGGFHRYSTDRQWLAPHFEKMLYDNAQLVPLYLAAYQLTGRERFREIAQETLRYVSREMTSEKGTFYSATDADSLAPGGHDEEGYFFTWTPAELTAVLGPDTARVVSAYYGVTPAGNFEGRNILHRRRTDAGVAQELGIDEETLRREISAAKVRLYAARQTRKPPLRDDKIVTAWNGLMISAFARAGLVLGEPKFEKQASQAAERIIGKHRTKGGRLLRSVVDGKGQQLAYLDDYAFLIQGVLDLYEASAEPRWLERAVVLQRTLDTHYWDAETGGYFMTSDDHEELLARDKPSYDGAEPSGNSVALLNLLRLSLLTSKAEYTERAQRGLAAFSREVSRSPTASPKLLSALDHALDTPLEVFVITPKGANAAALLAAFRQAYLPNRIFTLTEQGPALERRARLVPGLEGKHAVRGLPTAFVCERGRCKQPTSDPEVFARQLREVEPLLGDEARAALPVVHAE